MRALKIYLRALRLRCPECGYGKLYRGLFSMNEKCSHCGASFTREPGFYLGSIYLNYGLTTLLMAVIYPLLLFSGTLSNDTLFWGALVFVVIFPLVFFHHARALWLGFDEIWDPPSQQPQFPAGKAAADDVKNPR